MKGLHVGRAVNISLFDLDSGELVVPRVALPLLEEVSGRKRRERPGWQFNRLPKLTPKITKKKPSPKGFSVSFFGQQNKGRKFSTGIGSFLLAFVCFISLPELFRGQRDMATYVIKRSLISNMTPDTTSEAAW